MSYSHSRASVAPSLSKYFHGRAPTTDRGHTMMRSTALLVLSIATVVANASNNQISQESPDDTTDDFATVQSGINVNVLVDGVLKAAREAIVASHEDRLPLPDLTEDFYKKIWPFVVHGHLHCTQGSLWSLASVQRTGDAKLGFKNKKFVVTSEVGLQTLIVNYTYDASILQMGATGKMKATVGHNSATLVTTITFSPKGCEMKMEKLNITELGPINVTLTGLYPFDGLSSAIASKAADSMHDTIRQAAESALQSHIQAVINKVPCHF